MYKHMQISHVISCTMYNKQDAKKRKRIKVKQMSSIYV